MASRRVTPDPLNPVLNLWEEECGEIAAKLKSSYPELEFNLIAFKEFIYVDLLIVPEEYRGQGFGTKFMSDLIEAADEINCPLALTPDVSYGSSDESRLEEFNKRFGFIMNLGKDRDFSTNHTMIRPRKDR